MKKSAKKTIRLDKMLGNLGFGTRSGIKALVRQGAVAVGGERVKDPGMQIDPHVDEVAVDGQTVRYRDTVYILLHKPAGVVSATEDVRDRTVLDLLDPEVTVFSPFPVGRLDKDTEGLLLLTNDGKLAHGLLSPRKHVSKTYRALVAGSVGEEHVAYFRQGVELDDGYVTMPAELKVLAYASAEEAAGHPAMMEPFSRSGVSPPSVMDHEVVCWIELTIHEGKFHQVKRMFEAIGRRVMYLRRIAMGPLSLDPELSAGQWRELTEEEIENLRQYRKDGTD